MDIIYCLPSIVSALFMNSLQLSAFKIVHDVKTAVIFIFAAYYVFETNDASDLCYFHRH